MRLIGKALFSNLVGVFKPQSLKKGDTIGIAAPASPFDVDEFKKGVQNLESFGFKIHFRKDIFDKKSYLAGSDQRRSQELIEFLENPNIKALFFARGGYGMMRLIPYLEQHSLQLKPKIVLGYSDLTTLFLYLYQKYQWISFYGPVVAKDLSCHLNEATKENLLKTITQTKPLGPFSFSQTETIRNGTAEGILMGGCLSLVVASLGTPYEIDTQDKILFLEDINEKPYSVDRMLTQLKQAGKLKKVKGILFGSLENGGSLDHFSEIVSDILSDFKGPILFNFPAGHSATKITLPLGIAVRLDATKKELTYLESACV